MSMTEGEQQVKVECGINRHKAKGEVKEMLLQHILESYAGGFREGGGEALTGEA